MILGTFINGYKSYKKSVYIPMAERIEDKYSTYIGDNGVGKSAIFEALDVFFNCREWNVNKGANKEDIYISMVFLIEKKDLINRLKNSKKYNENDMLSNDKSLEDINNISNYILNDLNEEIQGATRRPHIDRFFKTVNDLKSHYQIDDYYILVLGNELNGQATFRPLGNYILGSVFKSNNKAMYSSAEKIRDIIRSYYSYLYIPVEQNIDDILKVETKEMQTLMDRDILDEIDSALDNKIKINGKDKTILKFLNEHLNKFMENVNSSIQTIDSKYTYKSQAFTKKNLTSSDIREKILEAYFKKRTLKYNNRDINDLSSGEQRKALIDIAYAFLTNNEKNEKQIILAIDEPEVSLNVSSCFSQFERLEELANKYKNQVIISTHWYGSLPIIKEGNLYYLGNNLGEFELKEFKFFDYLTESRSFPDNIEFKSMFDLSVSILGYIRSNENSKWIICEGSSDRIYLESILGEGNYKILPVGGCRLVLKIYNLLNMSFNSENLNSDTKVLCLIDTDEIATKFEGETPKKSPIKIRRLHIDDTGKIELIDPYSDGKSYKKTEIEDCLNPKLYYEAVSSVIDSEQEILLQSMFDKFEYNIKTKISSVEREVSILKPKSVEALENKKNIIDFLSKGGVKFKVAKEYSRLHRLEGYTLKDSIENEFRVVKTKKVK